ncbi:LamG-like jellyroll fold domain-containing protein [Pedobacter heparinus]|uniref:LamG-like jellyroll fold domain-containing protein n=1 Tax=Pedobacter heparinus TaxID=984 RepID=UPI00292D112E|nr:LamG-like jellyroll fold domain-containing protein [Pedobacter heparinus]
MFFLFLLAVDSAAGQSWMPGYGFRKKITIDKSKVSGTVNLINFPVLIVLQDAELKYISNCEGRMKHSSGLDISFAAINTPLLPLGFQLDHYDPVNGKLVCWVNINELFAGNNAGSNEIYLYYGATVLHDPFSLSAKAGWSFNYQQVWHLNLDAMPSISRSANRGPEMNMTGNPGMSQANFSAARIGNGLLFNGSTDGMTAAADTNTTVCISAWVKLHQTGTEQIILASDTTAGGYVIKLNAQGNLVFETKSTDGFKSVATAEALLVNTWYHLTCIFIKGIKRIYLNGVYKTGGGSSSIKLGRGGALRIGKSKQNDRYFKGMIDELRIQNMERSIDWLSTEYRNQDNPGGFISIAAEEINPANVSQVYEFTGAAGTQNWTDEGNWNLGRVPGQNSNVTIKAGRQSQLPPGVLTALKKLDLEPGAILHLETDLELQCALSIASSAAVVLGEGVQLAFKYDVQNNGTILLNGNNGGLAFKGNHAMQTFSGTGTARVSRLEIGLAAAGNAVLLQSNINVSKQVELIRGTIHANGKLTLLSTAANQSASLMPVTDTDSTKITGDVNVQHYIAGNFNPPSTARGWWLLAAPVYQPELNPGLRYGFSAVKASVFVTGTAGIQNGFDASPNNGGTIYTHDQSLPGSLSQKYRAIPNMAAGVSLGKGFYLFSRGSRNVPDAYLHQIQTPPFSNPAPYLITYTGQLYTGNLTVELFNRNTGAEGDGFNLLGNPYASALRWGALQKTNVSPFIWVFDPQNNAYQVTDDPAYIIRSGTGFFVRVNHGNTDGTLSFHEAAKYTPATTPALQMSVPAAKAFVKKEITTRLNIQLCKDGLSDHYALVFRSNGNDGVNDSDAAKIGEGYLSIAGMALNGTKLAIDERAADTLEKEIGLYVKGWVSGNYMLNLKAELKPGVEIVLADHYLGISKRLLAAESTYQFFMDNAIPATYGIQRFSIIYKQLAAVKTIEQETARDILIYPNPFKELFYLKSRLTYKNLKVLIRDVRGRIVWSNDLPVLNAGIPVQQCCGQLQPGIYFMQLLDQQNNSVRATFKIWRN